MIKCANESALSLEREARNAFSGGSRRFCEYCFKGEAFQFFHNHSNSLNLQMLTTIIASENVCLEVTWKTVIKTLFTKKGFQRL